MGEKSGIMGVTMEQVQEMFEKAESVQLSIYAANTLLRIQTENSLYHVLIIDPIERAVIISGGSSLPRPVQCNYTGATLGESSIRLGHICRGLKMEFNLRNGNWFRTSQIQSLAIEDNPSQVQYMLSQALPYEVLCEKSN